MNPVFVDLAKNIKNVAGLYNKNIAKKVNKNIEPTTKKMFFLFLLKN